jgi:uncharacterized protein (DUF433 family)
MDTFQKAPGGMSNRVDFGETGMTTRVLDDNIVSDERILGGEPVIQGTRTPVRSVAEFWRMGMGPDEIPSHLPHLTLAQVFDALSYYSDHREEIQQHIEANHVESDANGAASPR